MPVLPIDSGRYGSKEIREIFEESSRLKYILAVEAAVAEAQAELGIIPAEAGKEIASKASIDYVTLERCKEVEKEIGHEPANVVEVLVGVCGDHAKPWVHYGMTSNDLLDTATSLQIRDAMRIIEGRMRELTTLLAEMAQRYAGLPAVGRTHGQHASIISFGLKFAVWASEMLRHFDRLSQMLDRVLVCKTLGVVGTGSVMGEKAIEVQRRVAEKLGLRPIDAATQVVPRELYAEVVFFAAMLASTLDRISTEIRNLQRTEICEVEEPFRPGQVGSSAVPVKRNPIKSEKVSSIARLLRPLVQVALENIPLWHERDLTNSANERFIIPMSLILLDEALRTMVEVISGLKVNEESIMANIQKTGGRIFSEFVLDLMLKKGFSRVTAYRLVQRASEKTDMPFLEALLQIPEVSHKLSREEIEGVMKPGACLGASKLIISEVVERVKKRLSTPGSFPPMA
ncbi:MAG: adenylosuccinate lyase [Candidatus Terraquivivens tikiterensis]|uniref:Adenylosuccinate lyase n=1 Tax=Candidatus Terraquivivens tikiterensis TaxID=1980982 RepID=A0A2R7Y1V8_9ARCH|nr:MAG: adenylosuccinate lyase [Candidatus Terraquivivens tikiterensis]